MKSNPQALQIISGKMLNSYGNNCIHDRNIINCRYQYIRVVQKNNFLFFISRTEIVLRSRKTSAMFSDFLNNMVKTGIFLSF